MAVRSEHLEQKDVINYFHRTWPQFKVCIFSCPSGFVAGGRNKHAGINKLKSEGWKTGVADLQVAIPRGGFHGLFIEMKKSNGKLKDLSDDQLEFIDEMNKQGYYATWCPGAEEAIKVLDMYMRED